MTSQYTQEQNCRSASKDKLNQTIEEFDSLRLSWSPVKKNRNALFSKTKHEEAYNFANSDICSTSKNSNTSKCFSDSHSDGISCFDNIEVVNS